LLANDFEKPLTNAAMSRPATIDDIKNNADLFNLALYRVIRYMLDPSVSTDPDNIRNIIAIRSRLFIDCAYTEHSKDWLLRWAKSLHFEWTKHLASRLFKEYFEQAGKDNVAIEPADKLRKLAGVEFSHVPDTDGRLLLVSCQRRFQIQTLIILSACKEMKFLWIGIA
jgi:hypothetical protein